MSKARKGDDIQGSRAGSEVGKLYRYGCGGFDARDGGNTEGVREAG